MVCLYRCRLVLLLDRLAGFLVDRLCLQCLVPFESPFAVDSHGMHISHSFSVVSNKLKLDIVLGSEVNLYTAI